MEGTWGFPTMAERLRPSKPGVSSTTTQEEFLISVPPDPADVRYDDLQVLRSELHVESGHFRTCVWLLNQAVHPISMVVMYRFDTRYLPILDRWSIAGYWVRWVSLLMPCPDPSSLIQAPPPTTPALASIQPVWKEGLDGGDPKPQTLNPSTLDEGKKLDWM